MSIKNILAAYGGKTRAAGALRHAIRIAAHSDAWITGVIGHGTSTFERQFDAQMNDALRRELRKLDSKRVEDIKARFESAIAQFGDPARAEFVDLEDTEVKDISAYARLFDLVVIGNPAELPSDSHLSANPDRIALQSGRPVLIVPEDYKSEKLADHALIAWDGQRSAARAVGDAMPVLEEKPEVTVLTIGTSSPPGTDRLMINLARHGIRADLQIRPREGSTGRSILTAAEEISAKVIVMGAFEHSKFAHDLFGGVTTDVMRHTKVPVFMSH